MKVSITPYKTYNNKKMILSYRKRVSSQENLDNENVSTLASTRMLLRKQKNEPEIVAGPSSSDPNNQSNGQHRKHKSFSSFFQNLFQGNTNNNSKGEPSSPKLNKFKNDSTKQEVKLEKNNQGNNDQQVSTNTVVVADTNANGTNCPQAPERRRNSNTSFTNDAYSSSSESINTILSTNSFSFVHPKKYKGKKIRGKRIPIDESSDGIQKDVSPVKLRAQNAQPLPNSRRKKLGTLGRLSMKIGLKSKYNLQSCESLASMNATAVAASNSNVTGNHVIGLRTRSNKRRAPLPPSRTRSQTSSSYRIHNEVPGTTSTVVVETVQLKSVNRLGSREKLSGPTSSSRITKNSDVKHDTASASTSFLQFANAHRRSSLNEGINKASASSSSSRNYFHVRGKRKAPIPPSEIKKYINGGISYESHQLDTKPSTSKSYFRSSNPNSAAVLITQPFYKRQTTNNRSTDSSRLNNHTTTEGDVRRSMISEDEEIVQNILNAKQEEEKIVVVGCERNNSSCSSNNSPKPGTSGISSHNRIAMNSMTYSVSANKAFSSPSSNNNNNNGIKISESTSSSNKNTDYGIKVISSSCSTYSEQKQNSRIETNEPGTSKSFLYHNQQQQQQQPQKSAESQIQLQIPKHKQKQRALITTLSCYEEFKENEYENDDEEEEDKSSTNSLLVHEAQLNEQVKSQLTNSSASATATSSASSSKMPSFFSFKSKKRSGASKSQYANSLALFNKNGYNNTSSTPPQSPKSIESNSIVSSPNSPSTPTRSTSEEPTTPTKMTPRPWYKRSTSKDKSPAASNNNNYSNSSQTTNKARPSINILTKISELDREAVKIIEEKKRRSAIEKGQESAQELIAMFNTFNLSQQSIVNPSPSPLGNSQAGQNNSSNNPTAPSAPTTPTGHFLAKPKQTSILLPSSLSSTSSGNEERKKLAIVQPQSNPNFKIANTNRSTTLSSSNAETSGLLQNSTVNNIVELQLSPNTIAQQGSSTLSDTTTEDWICPRCTLKNVNWRSFCDACHYRRGSSTVVQSMTSMFESTTANTPKQPENIDHTKPSTSANATPNVSKSQQTVFNNNTTVPLENLQSQISPKKEYKQEKKFDGIKLADDPEVGELDIKKIREARLAFFRRHKVTIDDIIKSEARSSELDKQLSTSHANKMTSNNNGSHKSSPVLKSKIALENDFKQIKPSISSANSGNSRNNFNFDNEKDEGKELDKIIQIHQELNPNITDSGPKTWKPLYSSKFNPILDSVGENSQNSTIQASNNSKNQTTASYSDKYKKPLNNYEVDPTYENWHLKLSEIEKENTSQNSAAAFIKNISTEIKDQIIFFDRLKRELKEKRTAEEDQDYTSESDASTVVYEPNMVSRGQYFLNSVANSSKDVSRRRTSLGDDDLNWRYPTASGSASSLSKMNDPEKRRSSYENSYHHGGRHSTANNLDRYDGSAERRRQHNRALEHSSSSISKLLRKLEWAINVGDHKLAAALAHDLAIMKANCNLQKIEVDKELPKPITIRVYVEDRVMQQGPFQVPATLSTSVKELKVKIESDWGIPVPFQKWILGRKIADNDEQTLADYEIANDSLAFLYLVSPADELKDIKMQSMTQEKAAGVNSVSNKEQNISSPNPARYETFQDPKPCSSKQAQLVNIKSNKAVDMEKVVKEGTEKPKNYVSPGNSQLKDVISNIKASNSIVKDEKSQQSQQSSASKPTPIKPMDVVTQYSKPQECCSNNINGGKIIELKLNNNDVLLTGNGVPKHNKNISSKYIESINQTTNEPLSLPNSILKEKINNNVVEKEIKKQSALIENLNVPITYLKTNNININEDGKKTTALQNGNSKTTVKEDLKVSNSTKVNRILQQDDKLETPKKSKQNNNLKQNSKAVEVKTNDVQINKANEKILIATIHVPVGTERLLETNTELQNKHSKPTQNSSKNFSGKGKQTKPIAQVAIVAKSKEELATDFKIAEVSTKELRCPSKLQSNIAVIENSNPKCQSLEGSPAPNVLSSQNRALENKMPKMPATNSKNELQSKLPEQVIQKPPNLPISSTSPKNLEPTEVRKADHDQVQMKSSSSSSVAVQSDALRVKATSPPQSPNKQSKSVNVNMKSRWGSPSSEATGTQDETKNETKSKVLLFRKGSDASDINVHAILLPQNQITPDKKSNPEPSIAGAAQVEKKEDNNETYRRMLQLMENEDCVRNTEQIECPICFVQIEIGQGITLRDCLHNFCRDCVAATIQYCDEPQVKCPFRDNNYSCESFLQEREIKGLVSPLIYEKHLAQSVKLAENKIANTFHCKSNDCTGWCIFEDDVNIFKCPVCKKSNCLTCQAIHQGKNCQQYQREMAIAAETDEGAKSSRIMLEKMIQRGEALECPACHVVLLKKWGCDWVRCSYCKTEICWITKGFRWGPNGKGDTSAGCKCGINGVKCHPKCTYCH